MTISDLKILFKIASRERPEQLKALIQNINYNCADHNHSILVSADLDDETMYNDDIHTFCVMRKVSLIYGKSKNKIDAINRDMNAVPEFDILVNVSDDQLFTVYGFDRIIKQDFISNIPDLDGVLHYPDNHRSDLMTMSVMGLPYYKRFNYIYYPGYGSFFCDKEAQDVAIILKRYKRMSSLIFEHNHPNYTKATLDKLYTKNESYAAGDEIIYNARKKNNFHLDF